MTTDNSQPQVINTAQYVKDCSFEAPGAPFAITKIKNPPKIDLSVDIKVQAYEDDNYEVALVINVKATDEELVLFVLELEFGSIFNITGINDETQKEQILLIYCPSLIFPFARRIVSDLTRDGGFQPLMLNPIDFAGLYASQKEQQSKPN